MRLMRHLHANTLMMGLSVRIIYALVCGNPPPVRVNIQRLLTVLHVLDGFFKQHQVHDSVQLIIMLQSISESLLEFLPV